ncbi:alpha/beta-hydrolase [Lojkania enalia]|uniref:Alpha/beta-hydrolase n=1 Tax=Lojkania enalia TaxID=147567 RepID=A0A9P4NAK3_9PLEO|nr:alpha/beta-hydrolase [Didymosphaeria enalia]
MLAIILLPNLVHVFTKTIISLVNPSHNMKCDLQRTDLTFICIATNITSNTLQVNLGYKIYEGVPNARTGLKTFHYIRFTAPPLGSFRWQAPQPPTINHSSILPATAPRLVCPQSLPANEIFDIEFSPSTEDCLFLNAFAPANASNLPALDSSRFVNGNENGIPDAFGLSSDEVSRNGVMNVGLLDQQFALQCKPSQSYYAFAITAGCPLKDSSQTIFECPVSNDSETLQRVSYLDSMSGAFGSWAFFPVTDALLKRKMNGLYHLSGNNAEEGPYFAAQNITTEADLIDRLHLAFPLFVEDDIAKILYYYPTSNPTDSDILPKFATAGNTGYTAINLAEAYNSDTHVGYRYQYSIPLAIHASDMAAYFGPPTPNLGPDFIRAFQRIWGNFVKTSNPSISSDIARGAGANASARSTDLNETGGEPFRITGPYGGEAIQYGGEGLRNDLGLVNAYTWEGGMGVRCDFWRSVAAIVPE